MIANASPEIALTARRSPLRVFLLIASLTAGELAVVTSSGDRAPQIASLVCLLLAKVAAVLTGFMGASGSRRAARLVVVALVLAAGFAVVLMADTAARARHG